jgi:hypothetical protein
MSAPLRNLRLLGKTTNSLSASSGGAGEIFWDSTLNVLRLFNGQVQGGRVLADRAWVTANSTQLPTQASNSGKYLTTNGTALSWATVTIPAQVQPDWNATSGLGQILNKPSIPSLTGYATESYVTTAISGISIPSLTGYATETYVGDAIGAIPPPSFSNIDGLSFSRGVAVAEFSSDDSMTDDANDTVPVESAVRGYIDRRLGLDHDGAAVAALSLIGPGYAPLNGAVFTGTITLQQSTEVLNTKTGATGTVTHDFSTGTIWYHTSMAADFVVNFTNVPTTNNRTISAALVLVQGATARLPIDLSVAGVAQTIKWLTTPTGSPNKVDLVSFTLIRTGSAWTVLGSLSTYG